MSFEQLAFESLFKYSPGKKRKAERDPVNSQMLRKGY